MKFRQIYFDGCDGWRLGSVVEAEPDELGGVDLFDPSRHSEEDRDCYRFWSRNRDGLLERIDGDGELLVPLEE